MDNAKYARRIKWFLVVSLVFQLVGFITPGWLYHVDKSQSGVIEWQYMVGLWYLVDCRGECVYKPLSEWKYPGIRIECQQVETTLALFLCIIAVYMSRKKPKNNSTEEQRRVQAYKYMICCALSSILSITAVATWITYAYYKYMYRMLRKDNATTFPFSLLFTGLGGVLAGLAFLTNVIWRPWKHNNPDVNYEVSQNARQEPHF